MSSCQQIPGVETQFSKQERRALIEHFGCKTQKDLTKAALRYESLFFLFDYGTDGLEPRPYDAARNMRLALALAELAFSNLKETDKDFVLRTHKGSPGRRRNDPLPPDVLERFDRARAEESTNERAVRRMVNRGELTLTRNRTINSVVREIQRLKQRRREVQKDWDLIAADLAERFPTCPPQSL